MSLVINHYEFGKVIVNNKIYTKDIKIFKDKIISPWWRKEGHLLCLDDIKDILSKDLKVLIVGCGANSIMEVSEEVKDYCLKNNIELHILNSYDAVKKFNSLNEKIKSSTALCLHLTC
jgi:hypothetical protein